VEVAVLLLSDTVHEHWIMIFTVTKCVYQEGLFYARERLDSSLNSLQSGATIIILSVGEQEQTSHGVLLPTLLDHFESHFQTSLDVGGATTPHSHDGRLKYLFVFSSISKPSSDERCVSIEINNA
jgi:hypothetical protein